MNCKFCDKDATKQITWADGRGVIHTCSGCVGKAKQTVIQQNDRVSNIKEIGESDSLPQPKDALKPTPEFSHFSGLRRKEEAPFSQQPKLQHELSTESGERMSPPGRGGLRMSLLYDTQHPLNALPPELKRRLDLMLKAQTTMPSMTNYSNMDAPTPMKPKDRPT